MHKTDSYSVGMGILSWRAPATLRATLESYRQGELFSLFSQTLIFFQEISAEDRAVAAEFGLRAEGSKTNIGIRDGMKKIAELLETDYVLHLENDLPLVADKETAHKEMAAALANIESGKTVFYRMDERKAPSENIAKYMRYYPASVLNQQDNLIRRLRRLLRPAKARRLIGLAAYADKNPHLRFPQYIRRLDGGHLAVNSAVLNWANRAPLYPRRRFLEEIIPFAEKHPTSRTLNGRQDLEKELNCRWWRNRDYSIGICRPGLFAHRRLDRPENDEKRGLHSGKMC
ncbi:MAG: hypothetical protein HAW59_04760 [Betaproteobacteria bacterium]|nr:hypothetical protein [Betaproteobacteria bacterium]